jgi:hypothetical protein
MKEVVNVVVTCTKDKRHEASRDCQLRNVPKGSLQERFDLWHERTSKHWNKSVRVMDLYAGDHWANVRGFTSSYFEIDLWVCSAGFGLLHADDQVPPYAATFTKNEADSITAKLLPTSIANLPQTWWASTTMAWKPRFAAKPRSLAELMACYPKRSLVVVASENYLRAISDDLRLGIHALKDQDQLAIISAGAKNLEGLDQNLVPCDARFQRLLGGARSSLNTRFAGKILRESQHVPRASLAKVRYQRLLDKQPPIDRFARQQLSDEEIKDFIRRSLKFRPNLQHSPLLRALRDSNMACEQKRFSRLFREVTESLND